MDKCQLRSRRKKLTFLVCFLFWCWEGRVQWVYQRYTAETAAVNQVNKKGRQNKKTTVVGRKPKADGCLNVVEVKRTADTVNYSLKTLFNLTETK